MTTLTATPRTSLTRMPRDAWARARRVERVAYVVGALLFVAGLAHVVVLLVTGRTWTGPVSLRKAATFGLSFGLTLATVAWATSFVTLPARARGVVLGAFTAVSVVETALVSMQAWRGVPSHFNFETGFDTAVSMTLAVGGGVIIATAVAFTIAALRANPGLPRDMRLAIRFGMLSLLVALGTGAAMIADGVVKSRGGDPQLAYTTAGALKPLHAVAMHAILVVPAWAWLLRLTRLGETTRARWVWAGVLGYGTLIASTAAWLLF